MICTTLEQSHKLVELGIDLSTSDMYYCDKLLIPEPYITKTEYETQVPAYKGAVPAWSLDALIDLLPESISCDTWDSYNLYILKRGIYYVHFGWDTEYIHSVEMYNKYTGANKDVNTLVDAAVETIFWLKDNKYI